MQAPGGTAKNRARLSIFREDAIAAFNPLHSGTPIDPGTFSSRLEFVRTERLVRNSACYPAPAPLGCHWRGAKTARRRKSTSALRVWLGRFT